ncbi:MAG TPA: hypothetical protein VII35_07645 [Steroidobacteraceae bacterium]
MTEFDPQPETKSTLDQATETIQSATRRVSDVVDAARQPDMPLDVLTKLVRQAPLPALGIAFLIGVIIARR